MVVIVLDMWLVVFVTGDKGTRGKPEPCHERVTMIGVKMEIVLWDSMSENVVIYRS